MTDHAIPFAASAVPILGQVVRLVAWFPTAMIVCNCQPGNDAVLIVGVAATECPHCHKFYQIETIHHERGHPERQQFVLGVAVAPKPAS